MSGRLLLVFHAELGAKIKRKFGKVGNKIMRGAMRGAVKGALAGALKAATKAVSGKKVKKSLADNGVKVAIAPTMTMIMSDC